MSLHSLRVRLFIILLRNLLRIFRDISLIDSLQQPKITQSLRFLVDMLIRNNLTPKGCSVCVSFIEKFLHCLVIEHLVFFLILVDLDISLVADVASIALVIDVGFPSIEVVFCGPQIKVLLGSRFVVIILVLWCLDES